MSTYEIGTVHVSKRARLPHWDAEHAIYFVTWNLADALPASVLASLRERRDQELQKFRDTRGKVSIAEKRVIDAAFEDGCQRFLDTHSGECVLRRNDVAKIVADALAFFDEQRYQLFTWTIMPNHVHVVLRMMNGVPLSEALHSLKGYTSKQINKALGRTGTLWQAESFDRCVRNSTEMQNTLRYVMNNPTNAEQTEWPFAKSYPDRIAAVL